MAIGIECRSCGSRRSKVVLNKEGSDTIQRRRQCLGCGLRFNTYEVHGSSHVIESELLTLQLESLQTRTENLIKRLRKETTHE